MSPGDEPGLVAARARLAARPPASKKDTRPECPAAAALGVAPHQAVTRREGTEGTTARGRVNGPAGGALGEQSAAGSPDRFSLTAPGRAGRLGLWRFPRDPAPAARIPGRRQE